MTIVVTGGAGFIGANLCRELVGSASRVVAFDDLSSGIEENLAGVDVELAIGDIRDGDALDAALRDATSVVHLAARPSVPRSLADPFATHDVNATGTVSVLEAARRNDVGHVVVASSSSVYGANPVLPKREDLQPQPVSPYAASKLATESYALAWQRSLGLGVLAFRFFNVFGPLQQAGHAYAAVVPAFVDAALGGRPVTVYGDGTQTRDFTYVGTVARVLARAALDRTTHDGPVNLAFGTRVSLLELLARMEDVIGHPIARDHHPTRPGDVRDSQADSALLHAIFPTVEPVGLDDGLRATVDWFRSLQRSRTGATPADPA